MLPLMLPCEQHVLLELGAKERPHVCRVLGREVLQEGNEELELLVDEYVHQREDLQETSMKDPYEAVRQRFNLAYVAEEMRKKIKVMASSAVRETLRNAAEEDERTHVAKRRSRCARA